MTHSPVTHRRRAWPVWPADAAGRGYDAMEFAPHECHRDFPERPGLPLEGARRGADAPIGGLPVRSRPARRPHGPDPERRLLREVDAALGSREQRVDLDPLDSRPWNEDRSEDRDKGKGQAARASRLYRD